MNKLHIRLSCFINIMQHTFILHSLHLLYNKSSRINFGFILQCQINTTGILVLVSLPLPKNQITGVGGSTKYLSYLCQKQQIIEVGGSTQYSIFLCQKQQIMEVGGSTQYSSLCQKHKIPEVDSFTEY